MPAALRLALGLVVIIGIGFAIRYQYQETMATATNRKPADLGITEANGWKAVEFKPIDPPPNIGFIPTQTFPSKH